MENTVDSLQDRYDMNDTEDKEVRDLSLSLLFCLSLWLTLILAPVLFLSMFLKA